MTDMEQTVTYSVLIHRDEEDGSFWAEVQEMPGVFAAGDTAEELTEALEEAISLYLSSPDLPVTMSILDSSVEEIVGKRQMTFAPA